MTTCIPCAHIFMPHFVISSILVTNCLLPSRRPIVSPSSWNVSDETVMFKTHNYQPINVLKPQSCNFHFIGYFTEYNTFDSCYCKCHFHAKGTLTRYAQTAICWLESKFWYMRIIHDSSTLIARFFHVRVHKRKKFSKPIHNKSCI